MAYTDRYGAGALDNPPEIVERAHVKFASRKEGDTRSFENCKIDAVQKSFNGIYFCTLKKEALPKRRLRLF